ncbi:MAG: dephospho-CoA kinase [candidate division Zixibacteria bacterium]
MIIGVTGLFGSGKSEVARVFAGEGAILLDADKIAKEVVENNQSVLYQLVLEFGSEILNKNNQLNRRKLGLLIFPSPEKTKVLNFIVHPHVINELDQGIIKAKKNKKHVVIDAALLISSGYYKKMDKTVLVDSRTSLRKKRLLKRDYSEFEFKQRSKSQLSISHLKSASDFIITNNNGLDSLRKKSRDFFHDLTEKG